MPIFDYCIYIPCVSGIHTRSDVLSIMSSKFGRVERVDAINIPYENHRGMVDYDFSAFVYISEFSQNVFTQNILINYLDKCKPYELKLSTYDDECWILLKHPNSLSSRKTPTTTFKIKEEIEDLSAKYVFQDSVIRKQSQDIEKLNSIVQKQSQEINRIQGVIYSMLCRVYDPNTEEPEMFRLYNTMMHGKRVNTRWLHDENDDGTEEYDRAFMMERISESDDGSETSNEPIMDASASIPVTDRVRNTAELCGNN